MKLPPVTVLYRAPIPIETLEDAGPIDPFKKVGLRQVVVPELVGHGVSLLLIRDDQDVVTKCGPNWQLIRVVKK
jgi:hypothetical protein